MQYKSTRNSELRFSSAYAIARGISEEGGLFVPESFPRIGARLSELSKLDYIGRAEEILKLFLTDYTDEEIRECVTKAYSPEKFENDTPAKLHTLTDGVNLLELWHGPTCAFKDMALQLLPHLLTKALIKRGDGKEAVILVATSGDTGKAALEGFRDVSGTKIIVFYPENGVSSMQLRQMNTQEGLNVSVCAVAGNFDDCQTQVKSIFADAKIADTLDKNNYVFSSANSINWGRLLPQIVYYFSAFLDLLKDGKISSTDEKINVVVPTGNFGNILAAYYAMRMGLPVNKFICASNSNNVLTDFIRTGTYNKDRAFFTTVSPSMDILVSSNLERLIYHLCGEDSSMLSAWMDSLNKTGSYSLDNSTNKIVKNLFFGGSCSDDETLETIKAVYKKHHYLSDTHTAVAIKVYEDYVKETGDSTEALIVSTASPYKFAPAVLSALATVPNEGDFQIAEALSKLTDTKIPKPLMTLSDKKVRFSNRATKEELADFIMEVVKA